MNHKIPVTIITGFLGSGKTTIVHNLLKNPEGRRIAVLVNEFGEVGIDGEILKTDCDCEEENIVELSNGCLCCTVQEEFLPTMLSLMERKETIDHIVIETSGLALPKPLLKAFQWPDLKSQITVDAVITVVDAVGQATGEICNRERVQAQRLADDSLDHESSIEELFEDQLSCADMVIVSKKDLVNEDDLNEINGILKKRVRDQVKLISSVKGNIPTDVLLGVNARAEDDLENRPSHHDDHHHDHDHDHDHDDDIDSVIVELPEITSTDALVNSLKELVNNYDIYRIKGFLHIPGKPMRLLIQGVANRFDYYFDRKWKENEAKVSKLVVIGKDLKNKPLREIILEKTFIEA